MSKNEYGFTLFKFCVNRKSRSRKSIIFSRVQLIHSGVTEFGAMRPMECSTKCEQDLAGCFNLAWCKFAGLDWTRMQGCEKKEVAAPDKVTRRRGTT
jgi:hypothetical protein